MQMNALVALVRKDLVLFLSNRRALLITLAAPIVIAAFFGSLFGPSKDSERSRIPIAIIDLDNSATSQKVVKSMSADANFEVQALGAAAASDAVRRGKLRAVVTIPAKFGQEAPRALFSTREKPVIGIEYDPSQGVVLQVVEGLLTQHVMEGVTQTAFSNGPESTGITADARADVEKSANLPDQSKRDLLALFDSVDKVRGDPPIASTARADNAASGNAPTFQLPYTTKETAAKAAGTVNNYNSYSHSFTGMGVQFILFMGIDLGIKLLTMRRLGLWQRLRAAPLSRSFLLLSQVASGAIIAAFSFAVIFAVGMLAFGVRVEGSFVGFVGLILAFGCMTAAFGLFIAALGKTPEATRGIAIFATLIMVMLGGAWVPSFIFPQWLQTASLAMPTRWAVDGLDAMTWRGLGLEAAWQPIVVMLSFTLLFGLIAAWRFNWDEK
jgi:ABC-2 type transport system permease protein